MGRRGRDRETWRQTDMKIQRHEDAERDTEQAVPHPCVVEVTGRDTPEVRDPSPIPPPSPGLQCQEDKPP